MFSSKRKGKENPLIYILTKRLWETINRHLKLERSEKECTFVYRLTVFYLTSKWNSNKLIL